MSVINRHDYTARVLDPGGDIVLSLDENDPGEVTFHAGRIPFVEGSITVGVPTGHIDTVPATYTPWVEKRRNIIPTPRPTVYAGSGWLVAGGATFEGDWVVCTASGAAIPYIFTASNTDAISAGHTVSGAFVVRSDSQNIEYLRYGFRQSPGLGYINTQQVVPVPVGQAVRVEWSWVATVDIPAGSLHLSVVPSTAIGAFANPPSGSKFRCQHPVMEKATVAGAFFDGATPAPDSLTQHRWAASANASASVLETRTVDVPAHGVWVPQDIAGLFDALDPRDGRRTVIDVNATFPTETRQRAFNLGIREAVPNREAGTISLQLASDEALLEDFAQLTDDSGARAHQSSLRAVCNYALGKIGAALEPGGPDADVTAYWSVTNVLSDPACVSAANFASGGNATNLGTDPVAAPHTSPLPGGRLLYWTAQSSGQSFIEFTGGQPSARAGDVWTLQVYMRRAANAAPSARLRVYELDQVGNTLRTIESAPGILKEGEWTLHSLNFTVQNPATVKLKAYASALATGSGQVYALTAPMFHKGGEVIPPFSGSAGGPGYTYSWGEAANASPSTRTPIIERRPESLVWSAGVSGMAFLHPLLLASGIRLVCDENRKWTTRDAEYRADGMQNYRHGVNIMDARERLSVEAGDWFDAAVYEYVWTDRDGLEQRRLDTFALNTPPRKVLRVELRGTPYPGPGRAEHIVRRAQGRGRTVTVTATPTWLEETDQSLAVLLEGTPIQTGIAGTVAYDFGADAVTVTSRTTDTIAAAWILIPDGEQWTDSPVGASWTEEII